jgi:Tol biopolymer transport system component
MLTGRSPFARETAAETMAAVLNEDPGDPLPASVSPALARIASRCLEKTREMRFQSARDLAFGLEVLSDTSATAIPASAEGATRRWLPGASVGIIVFSLLAAGAIWLTRSNGSSTSDNPLANAQFTLLTNWEGTEEGAEISPDGKFVAFLADRAGEFDIWLSQIGTGRFSNLTEKFPALAPSGAIVKKLGFSADGGELWFNPQDNKPLMLMHLTDRTAAPFLTDGANTPAWSPDGSRIAYIYKPNRDDPMYVADRAGADARQLIPPGVLKINNPVWSADGQWIYFVRGAEPQNETDVDLWRVRSAGGAPERLTEQHEAINFPALLGSHTVLYVARAKNWSGPWLWAFDVDSRVARRVPSGVDQYTSVSASRDGRRVVATVSNPSANLWRVPLTDRVAQEADAQVYTLPVPTGRALAPRFGPSSLFYLSSRGTGDGLWKVQDGQASEVWTDPDAVLAEPAAVSPDGKRVVVVVRHEGKRHLAIMSSDGTNRKTLAPSIEIEGAAGQGLADWSPDGTRVVAGGRDAQGPALFVIPADDAGGAPIRLVEGAGVNPVWSPDGNLIVYAGQSIVGQVALRGVRPDGSPVGLPSVLTRPGGYRFLPDGKGLVYLPRIQGLDFSLLDLTTKESRPITQLGNRGTLRTFDITPDGRYIVFDRSQQNSNIVLIDLPE